ncbi:MAG: hypothetical protein ATN33_05875 [Epulopiscium sp. Nele67-Bin001]|nr:MAG: hypothetical protein ATN33_05875 [Epulopiscium sp. Nele67-Bin001]
MALIASIMIIIGLGVRSVLEDIGNKQTLDVKNNHIKVLEHQTKALQEQVNTLKKHKEESRIEIKDNDLIIEEEIENKLTQAYQDGYAAAIATLQPQIVLLEGEVAQLNHQLKDVDQAYLDQIDELNEQFVAQKQQLANQCASEIINIRDKFLEEKQQLLQQIAEASTESRTSVSIKNSI